MKKALAWALTLALTAGSFSSAALAEATTEGADTAEGLEISACIASEPETIDPTMISSVDGSNYTQHTFEGLMKYVPIETSATSEDSGVNLLVADYGQAESYEVSEDGLTYTFHLRDDICWSDGEPVTANDFVYSWQRLANPETAADYGYLLDGIVENWSEIQAGEKAPEELGITAVDDKTLEIRLVALCPYFTDMCCFSTLMPLRQDVIEEYDTAWTDPENFVCNGPYVMSDWVHDSYIEMVPNDYYYAPTGGPSKITWYLSADQTSMLASYQAGEYDFFDSVPADQITALRESGDCFVADQICTYYLYLNCDEITDWRVRAAINLVIDRENIVENVTQGGQTPATGLVAAGVTTYDDQVWTDVYDNVLFGALQEMYPDYDLSDYDERCDLAEELLDEAVEDGYDTSVTIDYEYNTSETHKAIAEAVQADVADNLGIDIVLNNQEWNVYTTNLGEGSFGMARLGWSADYDDPVTYVELLVNDGTYNYGHWVSDEYTELVAQAKSMADGEERDALMAEAEALMFSEDGFPIVPLYFYTQLFCMHEGFANVGWTPLGYFIFSYTTAA